MTTGAGRFAQFAAEFTLDNAPGIVVDAATWYLADTLACAIAAAGETNAPALDAVRRYADSHPGDPDATIIGSSRKTSLKSAALVNCTMARYLDANDIYMPSTGSLSGSGHFSDAIPAILSVAEMLDASGLDLLEAIIVAYEVQAALAEWFPWLDKGFHSVSQVTVAVSLAAGRLFRLTETELAHAASMALTTGLFVQSWLHPGDEVSAIKGGAPGLAAERGITCIELARHGFTSPPEAFERFLEYFCDPHANRKLGDDLGVEWRTPRTAIKPVPAQIYTQAVVQCAQELYRQGLRLESLANLTVRSNDGACGRVQGSPGAFLPRSRESADHSTPFVTAIALRDGEIGPKSYAAEPWRQDAIGNGMSKISLVIDDEWNDQLFRHSRLGAEVEASDRSGNIYRAKVKQFRGHPDNPLTREELVAKVESFIGGPDSAGAGRTLVETCESLVDSGRIESIIGQWVLSANGQER